MKKDINLLMGQQQNQNTPEETKTGQTDLRMLSVHHRHLFSNTNAIQTGLSTERPDKPTEYIFFFNTDLLTLSFWNGTAWKSSVAFT